MNQKQFHALLPVQVHTLKTKAANSRWLGTAEVPQY